MMNVYRRQVWTGSRTTRALVAAVLLTTLAVLSGASTATAEPVLCAKRKLVKIREGHCKGKETLIGPLLPATDRVADADLLDGLDSSEFLKAHAKASDADLLDGLDSSAFLGFDETAADADLLDGHDSSEFLPTTGTASGTTLTGAWGGRYPNPNFGGETVSYLLSVSFPVPAPVGLLGEEVNFAPSGLGVSSEGDSDCTGSVDNPTAPPGRVCIYLSEVSNVGSLGGFALSKLPGGRAMDRFGFLVRIIGNPTANQKMMTAMGTWAYTAP
jgi:hypothetical protein